jgi:hypothetical protein
MSDTDSDSDSDISSVADMGGAKRKNGHKTNCTCHICENMKNKAKRGGYKEDAEKAALKKMGGSKKKNGHKPNCKCPICKNMKNAKKGGNDDDSSSDEESIIEDIEEYAENEDIQIAGRKKKGNGHKSNCKCPICKNMRKKSKKGGDEEPDIENQLGDIEEGKVKGDNSDSVSEIPASSDDYDELDAAEKGESGVNKVGGTRKKRGSRKSNGHKANCGCPICKNMKRGRKTRRHRKCSHKRH